MRDIDAAADLFLGAHCPGCRTPGWGLCRGCRDAFGCARAGFVERTPSPPHYPPTVAAGEYDELARALVNAYKEHQVLSLGGVLAARLFLSVSLLLAIRARNGERVALVPIPSAAAAVRRRGLDVTATLARRCARSLRRTTGLTTPVCRVLVQGRAVSDQAGLTAEERRTNLAGAFRVRGVPPEQTVILIDDVTTTGSSLAEANRVLSATGVRVMGAAVLAATSRQFPPDPVPRRTRIARTDGFGASTAPGLASSANWTLA